MIVARSLVVKGFVELAHFSSTTVSRPMVEEIRYLMAARLWVQTLIAELLLFVARLRSVRLETAPFAFQGVAFSLSFALKIREAAQR